MNVEVGKTSTDAVIIIVIPLWNHDFLTVRRMWRSCFSRSSSTLCDWDSKGPENSTLSPWSR